MSPHEIAKHLMTIDPIAASIVLDAAKEASKVSPQFMLTDVVVMLMATSMADQHRKLIGMKANAEGRLAAIESKK